MGVFSGLETIRFEEPSWLWVAAGGAIVALIGLGLLWSMHWSRRWVAVVCRVLVGGLLALALAGAVSVRRSDVAAVIAVVDVSGSVRAFVPPVQVGSSSGGEAAAPSTLGIDAAIGRALQSAMREAGPEDLLGVVTVGGTAGGGAQVVVPARRDGGARAAGVLGVDGVSIAPGASGSEGTNLEAGIRLALAAIPPGAAGRVVVVSDGNQTTGDALAAAQAARTVRRDEGASPSTAGGEARNGVPIDVVPLRYDVQAEVLIDRVEAPTRAAAGSVAPVRVTLVSTGPAEGVLRLFAEGREVDVRSSEDRQRGTSDASRGRSVSLASGRTTITLDAPLGGGMVHRLEALFEPRRDAGGQLVGDTIEANNRGLAVTTTPGAGEVLLVDGVGRGAPESRGRLLEQTLIGQGLRVRVVGPEGIPRDPLSLQNIDLVILQNVAADAVPEGTQRALVRHVQEFGGGLLMVGGPDSFASGGWRGSVLEPILPVTLELPERLITASTALVIVLDSSGSMSRQVLGSGRSQQQIANAGAAAAIRSLEPTDLVGVVRFESRARWVVELGPNKTPAETEAKVLGIVPDGGTNLPPGLEMARLALKNVEAKIKHIVVLTDGVSEGRGRLAEIGQQLANDGIRVSTIAVGDDADTTSLQRLASVGGGEFFAVSDPDLLPRIFLRAVRVVRSPLTREGRFVPVVVSGGGALLSAEQLASGVPPLWGLTLTQPKIGADRRTVESVVYSLVTAEGEPVLASWAVGLGQVGAFTSDALGGTEGWAREWVDGGEGASGGGAWGPGGFGRFWGQVARAIARPPAEQLTDLSLRVDGGDVKVRLEALDAAGRPIDGLRVVTTVFSPREGMSEGIGGDSGLRGGEGASGGRVEVALSQTGPGVYEGVATGVAEAGGPGTYVALARTDAGARAEGVASGGGSLRPVVGGVVRPPGDEFRRLRSNEALLRALAEASGGGGGRVLTLDDVASMDARTLLGRDGLSAVEAWRPLWPWLIPAAIVLLLVDIAARRVAWERLSDGGAGVLRRARGENAGGALAAAAARKAGARDVGANAEPITRRPVMDREIKVGREVQAPASAGQASGASLEAGGAMEVPRITPTQESGLAAAKRRARERMDGGGKG